MGGIQEINPIDFIQFVVVKHLDVFIVEQVKVDLVAIIPNGYDKCPLRIQELDFFMQREISEFFARHSFILVSSFSVAI